MIMGFIVGILCLVLRFCIIRMIICVFWKTYAAFVGCLSVFVILYDFAPYVEKHKNEFAGQTGLMSAEIAQRQLSDFIEKNGITAFNKHQRIVLVASEFDEQTLSAVAWLNSNKVDISCYQICPYRLNGDVLLDKKGNLTKERSKDITRRSLPKIEALMEWKIVEPGDVLIAKGTTEEAILQKNGQVEKSDKTTASIQQWLKGVFGWSSVQTYAFCVDKKTGRTLMELREEYMQRNQ